jgi:hypothetical protein
MNDRADIEANLAKAEALLANDVTRLIKARAEIARTQRASAKAGARLPIVVSNLAKANAAAADSEARVAAVRADCRRLSDALEKLNCKEGRPVGYRSESIVDALDGSHQEAGKDRRKPGAINNVGPNRRNASKDRRVTRPPLANPNLAKPVVGSNVPLDGLLRGTACNQRVGIAANHFERDAKPHSTQASIRNDSAPRVLVLRAVELLVLTLAYLQYYFLDVSLQVARLPSVGVLILS